MWVKMFYCPKTLRKPMIIVKIFTRSSISATVQGVWGIHCPSVLSQLYRLLLWFWKLLGMKNQMRLQFFWGVLCHSSSRECTLLFWWHQLDISFWSFYLIWGRKSLLSFNRFLLDIWKFSLPSSVTKTSFTKLSHHTHVLRGEVRKHLCL